MKSAIVSAEDIVARAELSDHSTLRGIHRDMAIETKSTRLALARHPDSAETATSAIGASCVLNADGDLALTFFVTGDIGGIAIPPSSPGNRLDGLWETTCFEAFLKQRNSRSYTEVNVSPSSDWAVYSFDDYRKNKNNPPDARVLQTAVEKSAGALTLSARVFLPELRDKRKPAFALGLSAIIADKTGGRSYWAIAHPPGVPDFHHADCFKSEIRESETS